MAKLSDTFRLPLVPKEIDPELQVYLKDLVRVLTKMYSTVSTAVNLNTVDFVAQNSRPNPRPGQLIVWKNTDAAAGQPTHYLVYNDGTDIVTFASEETA